MLDHLVALVVDESKWLTTSIGCAVLSVAILAYRHRRSARPGSRRMLAAMSLFFAVTIGVMAFGHLLAVTTKLVLGRLEGSIPMFYLIGVVLAVPSWWQIFHTRSILAPGDGHGQRTIALNAWLAITLLALGLHNLPLAAPGFLNIAYHLHSGRFVGWVLVGLTFALNIGLFVGSLIFLASGQSFEQFREMQ